jgi:hypothetical protein
VQQDASVLFPAIKAMLAKQQSRSEERLLNKRTVFT